MNRILINSLCVVRQCIAVASLLAVFALMSAETAWAQVTMQIINNFKGSANYFSGHYPDSQVWLYFLNTTLSVSYISTSGGMITVHDKTNIQLSTVKDGLFTLNPGGNSSKVYAGLGSTSPFIPGKDGPGIFYKNVPYAELEWTVLGLGHDNTDVTYENTITFPTTLTVKDGGKIKDQSTFNAGMNAEKVITKLKAVLPNTPVGPPAPDPNYPKPSFAAGWGPLVPTVAGNENANRWIGSSKFWISGPSGNLRSMYIYAPLLKKYLQYLKDNETSQFNNNIKGWFIDYSSNNGYSGYLSVTGDSGSYGLRIHDIRLNTKPAAPEWKADPNAGTAANGEFTVAANNATIPFYSGGNPDGTSVRGPWTDGVIYSGAALVQRDLKHPSAGPVITGTGVFSKTGNQQAIVVTMLASISASMATGLLGSAMYNDKLKASTPGGTMYWFATLTRAQSIHKLFENAWPPGQKFYDPYWKTMAELTDMQGYLSPFNDRWTNFSPDFHLGTNYEITWELGIGSAGSSSKLTAEGKIAPLTPAPAKLTPSGGIAPLTPAPAKLTPSGKMAPLTP